MQNLGDHAVSGALRSAARRSLANAGLPQGRDPLACFFCYTPEAELGVSPFRMCSACARTVRALLEAPHVRRSPAGPAAARPADWVMAAIVGATRLISTKASS